MQLPTTKVNQFEAVEQKEARERETRKEDAKNLAKNLASVNVARALLGLGGSTTKHLKKTPISKVVDGMSPEQRRMSSPASGAAREREAYLNPASSIGVLEGSFTKAWEHGGLRPGAEDALSTRKP